MRNRIFLVTLLVILVKNCELFMFEKFDFKNKSDFYKNIKAFLFVLFILRFFVNILSYLNYAKIYPERVILNN